jgi:hypothetical protein
MVENFRHHRASRDVQVIIVPVPCGGSPEPLRRQPPSAYKRNQWSPWRPADKPPRLSEGRGEQTPVRRHQPAGASRARLHGHRSGRVTSLRRNDPKRVVWKITSCKKEPTRVHTTPRSIQ